MRYLSGLALVVAASLLPALAAGASLPPFSAEYRIYVNKIPTPIKADLVLEPASGEDRYHMRFEAHSWLLNNREESWFRWNDCAPRTERYTHEFKGFGKHRYHDTDFNWEQGRAVSESDSGDESFPIPDQALDELSMLLLSLIHI